MKTKNKFNVSISKRYLFNNSNIEGEYFYLNYSCINNPNNNYIKDLLFNHQIKSFNEMLKRYFLVVEKIKQHSKKTINKNNKKFKAVAVKMLLRYFKQQQKPLKVEDIKAVLNYFFGFKINGFVQNLGLLNIVKSLNPKKIYINQKEKAQQKYLKNSLYMDLMLLKEIRKNSKIENSKYPKEEFKTLMQKDFNKSSAVYNAGITTTTKRIFKGYLL